eukprot:Opistho-2@93878
MLWKAHIRISKLQVVGNDHAAAEVLESGDVTVAVSRILPSRLNRRTEKCKESSQFRKTFLPHTHSERHRNAARATHDPKNHRRQHCSGVSLGGLIAPHSELNAD